MDADIKKVKKLIKIMRAEGVLSLKLDKIELSLAREAILQSEVDTDQNDQKIVTEDQYTMDDLINWNFNAEEAAQ